MSEGHGPRLSTAWFSACQRGGLPCQYYSDEASSDARGEQREVALIQGWHTETHTLFDTNMGKTLYTRHLSPSAVWWDWAATEHTHNFTRYEQGVHD